MVTSCCIHRALSQMNTGLEFNSVHLLMSNWSEEISFEMYVYALMCDYVWVSEWDRSEERRLWLCFARGMLTVFNKHKKKHFWVCCSFALLFFIEWILVRKQAIFQNNIRAMLLTSSFPTMFLGEQSEESRRMAHNTKAQCDRNWGFLAVKSYKDIWTRHILHPKPSLP